MSKRKVYVGIEGKVYEVTENVARLAAKSGDDIVVSAPIDVLEAHFSQTTIKSIKQMLASKAAFTLSSGDDVRKYVDELRARQK